MSRTNNSIDYIELPLTSPNETKRFFSTVFGWDFQEWGPDYLSFSGAGIAGGFNAERKTCEPGCGTLVVLYSHELESSHTAVNAAGATISREIYEFPGGKRFHFIDPNGNEFSVWTESTS